MKKREHSHTSRIEARIAPDTVAIVRRATEIQCRSTIRLSREAQAQFVSLLLNPPPPSNALCWARWSAIAP